MEDYYNVLDVRPDASPEEIKQQYHFLAQALHPDRFRSADQKARAEQYTKKINEAYSVLRDPVRRLHYNLVRAGRMPDEATRRPERQQQAKSPPELKKIDRVRQGIVGLVIVLIVVFIHSCSQASPSSTFTPASPVSNPGTAAGSEETNPEYLSPLSLSGHYRCSPTDNT